LDNCRENNRLELLTIIVNDGWGTKMLHAAKKAGVCGGTIMLGRGTVKGGILKFLELYDEQKEIVLMLAGRQAAYNLLEHLDKEYRFNKPHHGIAFCIPVLSVIGSKGCKADICIENGGSNAIMYNAVYVIVDKGNAEAVIDAATKAGSTGGTVINARGSGIHETSRLFSMEIEPEKEVVLIISDAEKTEAIASSINAALELEKPGKGIMFIQDVSKIYGLREMK
jgi:nitrogen regulatory protein PII